MHARDAATARRHPTAIRFGTIAGLLAAALLAAGCGDGGAASTTTTTPAGATSTTTTAPAATTTGTAATDPTGPLFADADFTLDPDPLVLRQRAVEVNLGVLLRDDGRARRFDRIVVNLFPDTTYTGVIVERAAMGNGHTWVGYLEGFEVSALTMVWTGSAFAANFASPAGVYEVALAADGVYKVMQIDQEAFPGEA